MKKITLYTTADKRPDFIPLQHRSLKRFLKDEYEFVVLNNALDSKSRREEISSICKELGIRCVDVRKEARLSVIGEQKVFTWLGSYRNANVGTAYPIKWAWDMMIDENKDNLFAIIDSDMFLCRDISFSEEMGDNDASIIIQHRGLEDKRQRADVTYIWNAFCIFDPSRIPALKEMNWDCGIIPKTFINGYSVDVGGYIHYWLQENNLKFKHITELAVHKFNQIDDNSYYLEGTLNGNYHYSFEYEKGSRKTSGYKSYERDWQPGDKVLPHLPFGYEETLMQKTINCFETYLLDKQTYPSPTFIGFIEFESEGTENRPFIIHSKAGSGYMKFGDEYGKLKLQFIEKTLGL